MAYIELFHTSGMMVMIMLLMANCNTCDNKKVSIYVQNTIHKNMKLLRNHKQNIQRTVHRDIIL